MLPSLATHHNGIALVGEALGEEEAKLGQPFVGRAGFKLSRLLEWAGFSRDQFDIYNVVWCRPPANKLADTPYETGAINHCRTSHWDHLLDRSTVIVPMGNVPLWGLDNRKGILTTRGYVKPFGRNQFLLPTVHPSFIQRGQSKYSAPFINDIQKAVQLAQTGYPAQVYDYLLDPSPIEALQWAHDYLDRLSRNPSIKLAYDIETSYKDEDEADLDRDEADLNRDTILRIGFSYADHMGMSIPWDGAYLAAIETILGTAGEKVVWNAGFDNPRIAAAGVNIRGLIHDGMVAWHVLHSDLPKGLGFVATFTCPWQPEWKHLNSSRPAYYNCTDADVELRSMLAIEEELRRTGLWNVYESDVLDLEPILVFMSVSGMAVDGGIRSDRAAKLAELQNETLGSLQAAIPEAARKLERVYKKDPKDVTGLTQITVEDTVQRCSGCGALGPTKSHFRKPKLRKLGRANSKHRNRQQLHYSEFDDIRSLRKSCEQRLESELDDIHQLGQESGRRLQRDLLHNNPSVPQRDCSGETIVESTEPVVRYARYGLFKPSRVQLIAYQRAMGRLVPTKFDKKTRTKKPSMDEKAIKELQRIYPTDPVYPLVLTYRELDKIAGTYIGRPSENPSSL